MAELIIQTGKHRGKRLRLPDHEVVFGRGDECHIRLGSSDVSRRHCALSPSPEGLRVRDLGSRNGTFVNDVFVKEETLLKPGDVLGVGPIIFQVPLQKAGGEGAGASKPGQVSAQALSDNEIAHWLAEEGSTEELHADDTAVITTGDSAPKPQEKARTQPTTPPEASRPPGKKKFASIAEEAQDIIRRHREMVRKQEEDEGTDRDNGGAAEE